MKKLTSILILLFSLNIAFSQNLYDINLKNCKVKKQESREIEILGIKRKTQVYKIKAKVKVQTRCNGIFAEPTIKTRRTKYLMYTVEDNDSIYRDSVYSVLNRYWTEKEKWSKKYNSNGDFSVLPVHCSFYITDSFAIPYISTDHQRAGAFSIYYLNNRIYKFIIAGKRTKGFGSLNSFEYQNLTFMNNNKAIEIKEFVRQLDKAKELLNKE